MKIVVVTQYFWPECFRINDLVRELISRGHEVTVLTGIPNYPSGKIYPDYTLNPRGYDYYFGARVYRSPMLARGSGAFSLILNYLSFAFCASIYGSLRLFSKQFDLVFVYQLSPVILAIPAIFLSRLKRIPLIFWVQDLWPDTLISLFQIKNRFLISFLTLLVGLIYSYASSILVQSRSFALKIAEYVKCNTKIHYLPNWTDEQIEPFDLNPAPEVPKASGVFTVLFAGNVGEAQDFPSILDAAEILKENSNLRWIIVGSGRQIQWLHNQVILRGLSHCFLLLGRFPYERMPSFYRAADALLISLAKKPAFSLTIPSKLQSYLLSGVPLLGMLDGEGAHVILKANAGFVCNAGNSSALVKSVESLLSLTPDQRRQMGSNGRLYALEEFGKRALLDRLEHLFLSVV